MSEDLTVYMHILSPFSTMAVSFINHLGLPFTERSINLATGEHQREWYLKINPEGRIPAIQHGDVTMGDSLKICKYLVEVNELENPIYPYKDSKACEEIEAKLKYVDDMEAKTRFLLRDGYFNPLFFGGVGISQEEFLQKQKDVQDVYQNLEDMLAESETKFFCGDDNATLVDFYYFNIIYHAVDKDLISLDDFPLLHKWFQEVSQIESIRAIRARTTRLMRLVHIYGNYIKPVIDCVLCKRR
ncbi:unnamed protein product [Moneuplotes crassus]|uniref:Glutathione transferase n=1 Tax=Euplotes crassus TaxID=5936 RepID=A0AAD1XTQ6_EUPCR|nr:unnamed protein product [Moneuplotes crassus]